MKKILFAVFLLIPLFHLCYSNIYAQSCTGNSGGSGTCKVVMDCSPPLIDGQGTCPDQNLICCLDSPPTGDGGTGDCSDTCSTSADCLDTPYNLSCTNNVCTNSSVCQSCTGNSGYAGSCLTPGTCAGKSKNSGDGTGVCQGGSICCTNAPSSETCTITAQPPFLVGADFVVNLSSSEKSTIYRITTSSGCTGSCQGDKNTDSSGKLTCSLACGPPAASYTINAQHGVVKCSTRVDVLNEPGPRCVSDSGLDGWCVAVLCPGGTLPDGMGDCDPNNSDGCCVPANSVQGTSVFCYGDKLGISTAIGCIHVLGSTEQFLGEILKWAVGIGGGIAFLLILYAGFMIMTSAGNPERLKAGQELMTSAISGLILLIFSVFILKFIGLDILGLGSFGFGQ